MAKVGTNDDFRLLHPDWVRDAQKGNYTDLKVKVKALVEKQQDKAIKRRNKLGGKD